MSWEGAFLAEVGRAASRLEGPLAPSLPRSLHHSLVSLPSYRHSWADALSTIRLPHVKYICPHA